MGDLPAGPNLVLAREVVPERAGTAMGVKQSAVPLSGMLAGGLVPTLAVRLGWRAAFVLAGVAAAGLVLLAAPSTISQIVGALVACGAGWDWPALLHFSVLRYFPAAPAAATGRLNLGLAGGSLAGPAVFGVISQRSYASAWLVLGVVAVAAAVLLVAAERRRTVPAR